jgi:cbb3-type cytochrome oxidase maturation protein
MAIIILLISISLFVAVGFLILFLWNMKSGQYDDTYSPSVRMLFDDKVVVKNNNKDKDEKHTTPDDIIKKV